MASEIAGVRDWIVSHLASKAPFTGNCRVLSRKVANLQNEIERDLGKLGRVVIVNIAIGDEGGSQKQAVTIDPLRIVIRVVHNVLLKSSGPDALELTERVIAELKHQRPGTYASPITFEKPAFRQLMVLPRPDAEDEADYDAYDVFALTKLSLTPAT